MLRKEYRVTKKRDFEKIRKKGRFFSDDFITISFLKNNLSICRVSVVVSKKILKRATERNRLRRQIQEAIRINFSKVKPGFDIMILTKKNLSDFKKIENQIVEIFKKADLLK